jgi:hypothetical protein
MFFMCFFYSPFVVGMCALNVPAIMITSNFILMKVTNDDKLKFNTSFTGAMIAFFIWLQFGLFYGFFLIGFTLQLFFILSGNPVLEHTFENIFQNVCNFVVEKALEYAESKKAESSKLCEKKTE